VKQETETKAFFPFKATALSAPVNAHNTMTTVHVHTATLKRTRVKEEAHLHEKTELMLLRQVPLLFCEISPEPDG